MAKQLVVVTGGGGSIGGHLVGALLAMERTCSLDHDQSAPGRRAPG